jgi:aldose 1-epimerase
MAGVVCDRFGVTAAGVPVDRYTLRNASGMVVRLITYGATVTELWTPDRNGHRDDVVLGFDSLEAYETPSRNPYFGCLIGRVAFRIADATFELNGRNYELSRNTGPHHLHGGAVGFSRQVWTAEPLDRSEPAVHMSLVSPDGDQGYPGTVRVEALHTLTDANELRIDLTATTDAPTPLNLTHHGYFNLSGAGRGDVLQHEVQVLADRYCVPGPGGIPAGRNDPVDGTRFDLRCPTIIASRPDESGTLGFDLGYLLRDEAGPLLKAARVFDPVSGRLLEVETTEPALIFYTGGHLPGNTVGKGGTMYPRYGGVCLEPGRLPDSVHYPAFPSVIFSPDRPYRHSLVYRFATK